MTKVRRKALIVFGKYPGDHIYLDRLLSKAIAQTNTSIDHYQCPGLLPYCPAIDVALPQLSFVNLKEVINRLLSRTIFRPITCIKCRYQFNKASRDFFPKSSINFDVNVVRAYIYAFTLWDSAKEVSASP